MIVLVFILSLIGLVYFVSIFIISIGFVKQKEIQRELKATNQFPISIIIPVRNESENIVNSLTSIKNQSYSKSNYEIIVVNDHSSDNTEELVNDFMRSNSDLDLKMISLKEKSFKKEALKLGVSKARYEIIATTDADCWVPEKWLEKINIEYQKPIDMLLGPIIFKKAKGFLSNFQTLDMLAMQGIGFGTIWFNKPSLNNAANLSYQLEAYKKNDGYDNYKTPSGDDVFLLEKFQKNKSKIDGLLVRGFIVETKLESNWNSFLQQRLRWASKSKYYKNSLLICLGIITVLQSISLIFIYIGIPLVEKYRVILLILLLSKWLIDFILLLLVASFFERKKALFYFIPVQLIYPIYIFLVWVASLTIKFEWKGRKYNG